MAEHIPHGARRHRFERAGRTGAARGAAGCIYPCGRRLFAREHAPRDYRKRDGAPEGRAQGRASGCGLGRLYPPSRRAERAGHAHMGLHARADRSGQARDTSSVHAALVAAPDRRRDGHAHRRGEGAYNPHYGAASAAHGFIPAHDAQRAHIAAGQGAGARAQAGA